MFKTEVPINITSELKKTFDSVNKALNDVCELALKQPVPRKRFVLMTDASFKSAGYALMIEDNPDQKKQSKRKTYAPVAFGWKVLSPARLKVSRYSKEFLAIYKAFLEFEHILWEATKPTTVLTDNKSVTRFSQTKANPPALKNACNYVLQLNFKIAHIVGLVNTAAYFLSRLELNVTEKIRLKIGRTIAVRVTNTTESLNLIKKHTQIAEFSVVAPDQSKHIQPIDKAILSMIPQADSDLTADLNKPADFLRTNKPEHQNNTFWFQHLKILESLKITLQYRHEASKKSLNSKTRKNSIQKRA